MIAVTLRKDPISGKQLVSGYQFVGKNYTIQNPEIPGERIYVDEAKVPNSFYKDPYIHYFDSGQLIANYPNSDPLSRRFS